MQDQNNAMVPAPGEDTNQPLDTLPTETDPNPSPIPSPPEHKKRRNKVFILVAALILIVAGAVYWLGWHNSNNQTPTTNSQSSKGVSLATSQKPGSSKNRSSLNFAVGYVNYDAQKLKPIQPESSTVQTLSTIPEPSANAGISRVGFLQYNHSTYDRSLIMYDFDKKTFYNVDEETGKVNNFYDPVILSDHYVAFYLYTENNPTTIEASVVVVNLLTGQKTTLVKDSGVNLPWSACCSVSPDGLHLAMAIPPNKLVIYTAGDSTSQTITANADFAPSVTGQDNNSYAQAQRAAGYPKVEWADNSSILLATGAPIKYTVDTNGTHIFPAQNSLAVMDLASGKQSVIPGTDQYMIRWFGLSSNGKLAFMSFDKNTDLSGGPATGKAKLYIMDYKNPSQPVAVGNISHEMLGSIVLDSQNNKLYLQDSKTTPITEVDLNSLQTAPLTFDAQGTLIEGVYSAGTLISGNRDATLPSSSISLLDLSSDQLTTIH